MSTDLIIGSFIGCVLGIICLIIHYEIRFIIWKKNYYKEESEKNAGI